MSASALTPWIADALIVLGVAVMTLGVVGIYRMPDLFTKLHAASKSAFLGVCSFLIAVAASGDPTMAGRAALIALLLLFTTPVAAHEIAKAAARGRRAPLDVAAPVLVRKAEMPPPSTPPAG